MVGFQWRRTIRRQHQRVHSGVEHQHMCGDEPSGLDIAGRGVLWEAVSDRSCSGNDDRTGLHYARSR